MKALGLAVVLLVALNAFARSTNGSPRRLNCVSIEKENDLDVKLEIETQPDAGPRIVTCNMLSRSLSSYRTPYTRYPFYFISGDDKSGVFASGGAMIVFDIKDGDKTITATYFQNGEPTRSCAESN